MKPRYRNKISKAKKALYQIRGYSEKEDLSSFQNHISEVIDSTINSLGLKKRFKEEQVFDAWNKIVNPFIAKNAKPLMMKKDSLVIQVLHSTVYFELERMKYDILQKMKKELGSKKIESIKFYLG